jgi:hypothetical protein
MDRNTKAAPKKPYEVPHLRVYGNIQKLTFTNRGVAALDSSRSPVKT